MPGRKLLLADDSPTIQKVVTLTFTDEGIDVVTVGNGDSAMDEIAKSPPDLVMADVHMPGLNGYQICERLRRNEATKELPVLLLVGSFEPFDEAEAARVRADGHLTKPFQSIRNLVSRVTELIESSQSAPGEGRSLDDAADIDGLYAQSLTDTAEQTDDAVPQNFVDVGMDDEMIETTYSGDARPHIADRTPETAPTPEPERKTKPVSSPERSVRSAGAGFSQAMETSSSGAAATAKRMQPSEEILLDDSDLLELPPLVKDSAVEPQRPALLPATGSAETPVPSPAPGLAQSAEPVVNISPEVMEIIVQKVIEKLTDKEN